MIPFGLALGVVAGPSFAPLDAGEGTPIFDGPPQAVDFSGLAVAIDKPPAGEEVWSDNELSTAAGDQPWRVALLGSTLAERAADFGYLETEVIRRMPEADVIFRNLGWAGDNVTGAARVEFGPGEEQRSAWQRPDEDPRQYGFAKMMRSVKRVQPHVILIAYGSNAAFDDDGAQQFAEELERLLDALQPTGARLVLLSPPPRELEFDLGGQFDDQNRRLARVAKVLAAAAQERRLTFVDLFSKWPAAASATPTTDNGIHLNDRGYRQWARLIADELLPPSTAPWGVRLKHDGSPLATSGVEVTSGKATPYGLRWQCRAELLPPTDAADRVLQIAGLAPGTYTLDIDGRRVARASSDEWAAGVSIRRGPQFARTEELRQAILQKNRFDFYRRRPQNKAYIHLFRRHERGHHRAEVERFAVLVSEAEERIARLRRPRSRVFELVREDDYPDHEVPGAAVEANLEAEIAALEVPEGFEINLFASDPMISKPTNINWDEQGRLWVSTSTIYPHLQPGQEPNDRILILEDIDRDGRADRRTVFADGLLVPHSVLPGDGGAYVAQSTDLLFLRDLDGDGQADERRVLLTGFGIADVHHMIHQLRWGPGGDLYFLQSIYTNSHVETPWGVRTSQGACVWRLRPEALRLEVFATGLVNPWGFAFDPWGQSLATDGAGGGGLSYLFPGAAYRSHPYADRELENLNPGRPKECGLEMLSGRHLPEDWRQTFMSSDFRANRSTRYRLHDGQGQFESEFLGDMIVSGHRGFRPIDVKMGPDGAVYIADWYNLIIDHGEVDFHHPLRDKQHGRIWRLTAKGAPLVEVPRLASATPAELLDLLCVPEQWTRDQARRLLRERRAEAVLPALETFVADRLQMRRSSANLDQDSERELLEALWVRQGLRRADRELLVACLDSTDERVRAAAVRVLADWRRQVDRPMELLARAIGDENPRVRLEAVNALRMVGTTEAVRTALGVLDRPLDEYLDFALFRTVHELREQWYPDFEAGVDVFEGRPERIGFTFSSLGGAISTAPLMRLLKTGQLGAEQRVAALGVVASAGGPKERQYVASQLEGFTAKEAASLLHALMLADRPQTPMEAPGVVRLLDADDDSLRQQAMQLAGRWQLQAALPELRRRAGFAEAAVEERLIAGRAILAIDGGQGAAALREVFQQAEANGLQATAVAGWVDGAPTDAIPSAVSWLCRPVDAEHAAIVIDALVARRDVEDLIAASLRGKALPEATARLWIERIRQSGRRYGALVDAIRQAGGLQALAEITPAEAAQIVADVAVHGDVQRGREVYRRERLNCVVCHRINDVGGRVGPDLSSVGSASRTSDLLESILRPSATIKQGYDTVLALTLDGRVLSGVVQQRTQEFISIRDAENNEHVISMDDVEEIRTGEVSLMPAGLAETLTREDLVDLVCYLSSLGK